MASTVLHYENDDVSVTSVSVGDFDNNVYVARCRHTGKALLVDAANEAPVLLEMAERLGVTTVVTTHGHHDHVQAVPAMRAAGYPVGIALEDTDMCPEHDFTIADGQVFEFGRVRIHAVATPGHTPGSTCFTVEGAPVLFSGDTLFPGGPGATRWAYSSFATIIESIRDRLFTLPGDTHVLPGHGKPTTVGTEIPHLQEWIDRGW